MVNAIQELIETLKRFEPQLADVEACGRILIQALQSGQKIFTCGNGGSAADALHMAEELIGRFDRSRRALPAVCLAADPTVLTCIANDFGYEEIFARQIEGLGQPGDVLVGFSSSGNLPNVAKAIHASQRAGLHSIALLGKGGGKIKGEAQYQIVVPSESTARIQEIHTLILHTWLNMIDDVFCPNESRGKHEAS